MTMFNLEDVRQQLETISVIVVGDLILDRYLVGESSRLSPEAPVPVVDLQKDEPHLGGAANVARNLSALGITVRLVGVVGDDSEGQELVKLAKTEGMRTDMIVVEAGRPTTVKTRVMAGQHQLVRYDREVRDPLLLNTEKEIIERLMQTHSADIVIVSDYGKGVISATLMKQLRLRYEVVYVDPFPANSANYVGVDAVTPNTREAQAMLMFLASAGMLANGENEGNYASINKALQLREGILVTMGAQGMAWFDVDGPNRTVDTVARSVFDVTGAGDTVIACFTLARSLGLSIAVSLRVANAAAGLVVQRVGLAAPTQDELVQIISAELAGENPNV